MPITQMGYQTICSHSSSKNEIESIVIISIDEKEEDKLDKGFLQCTRDNQVFTIHQNEIVCYGEIDFSTGSDDYNVIEDMNWLDYLGVKGISIPSDYNYEDHCCYPSEGNRCRYTETFNPAVLTQYLHGKLGKPKRVCIFKTKTYGYRRT